MHNPVRVIHAWPSEATATIFMSRQMLAQRGRRSLYLILFVTPALENMAPPRQHLDVAAVRALPPQKPLAKTVPTPPPPKLVKAVAAATSTELFLSHHAAHAFFGPTRPPLSFVGCSSASGTQQQPASTRTPTATSCATAMSAAASASTEEEVQRRHFYGYGDPNHVPSILQNITAQRYIGEGGDVVGGGWPLTSACSSELEEGGGACVNGGVWVGCQGEVLCDLREFNGWTPCISSEAGAQGRSREAACLFCRTRPSVSTPVPGMRCDIASCRLNRSTERSESIRLTAFPP